MRKLFCIAASGLLVFSCQAETFAEYPDLPPLDTVKAAMFKHPSVLAAQAGVQAGVAVRRRVQAGSYETSLRVGGQQRTEKENENRRFGEWDIALERPLRLPAKAGIDQRLGEGEAARMRTLYGDALHETGRALLKSWFTWGRENAAASQWREQVELLREQLTIVEKRVRAGDAPRLEAGLAEAALAGAESGSFQAGLKAQLAANELSRGFAGVRVPASLPEVLPQRLEENPAYWREAILQHNHELAVARQEAALARMHGERADAETTPDPALGLRAASERGGAERVVGLSLIIPFSGAARHARSEEMQALAAAAGQREAAVLRKVELEADNTYASAQAAYQGWQSAQRAADKMRANADLLARAYALGEMPLAEVLTARRLALETRLSATLARLDAAENRYRLLLDAHQLWPLDNDE